jgi:hypothetical protein
MASQRQNRSNRENAQKSTGPRTAAGKAASRLGALRHGLSGDTVAMLPGEDQTVYQELAAELEDELGPQGRVEQELVEYLAQQLWRLRRTYRLETAVIAWYVEKKYTDDARTSVLMATSMDNQDDPFETEKRGATQSPDRAQVDTDQAKPVDEWAEEAERIVDEVLQPRYEALAAIGGAFVADASGAEALSKLSRYETALLRGVERTIRQLREAQAHRRAALPPPEPNPGDTSS